MMHRPLFAYVLLGSLSVACAAVTEDPLNTDGVGGSPSGGSSSDGGSASDGGSSSGGSASGGGSSSGGASSGGAATGGEPGSGGASTGGAASGGASTGGAASGGASTGGASSGGASSGGAATGGSAGGSTGPLGSCDFTAACALDCADAGGQHEDYIDDECTQIIDCLIANPTCPETGDPLCTSVQQNPYTEDVCRANEYKNAKAKAFATNMVATCYCAP